MRGQRIDLWFETFPKLAAMEPQALQLARGTVQFPVLKPGDVAYRTGWECPNYVMCMSGKTRIFRNSESGRELLMYEVEGGGTCVLTTHCLLSGGTFPAESTAEQHTELAALPRDTFQHLMQGSQTFREFVLEDYSRLLAQLITLVDDVTFSSLPKRLANRLLADGKDNDVVLKTHQQLALDLGSAREVISRHLADWEKAGLIRSGRGEIRLLDKQRLATSA
jgi:CRP/FNR family transcriptional regulator, anaerobic regulatory protein